MALHKSCVAKETSFTRESGNNGERMYFDRSLQYNDLSNRVIGLTKDDIPADLKKKVTLLIYFSQYMDEHLIYGAEVDAGKRQSEFSCVPSPMSASGVFMKKWFRTDRAIVMHLSNGTLQVRPSTCRPLFSTVKLY